MLFRSNDTATTDIYTTEHTLSLHDALPILSPLETEEGLFVSSAIRDVTERPETVEAGSNILSGSDPDEVARCVDTVLATRTRWTVPPEYQVESVSTAVAKIVLGYRQTAAR